MVHQKRCRKLNITTIPVPIDPTIKGCVESSKGKFHSINFNRIQLFVIEDTAVHEEVRNVEGKTYNKYDFHVHNLKEFYSQMNR